MEKYKESKDLIVIPVLSGFKSRNNSDKNPVNYLVLVFENEDSITRGNIIQYISSNGQKVIPQNTFSKVFAYKDLDCSGQFTVLNITDYFQYELKFEKGKLKSMAWVEKKTQSNSVSGRVMECIDWYLLTWYVWSDGSVELVSEVYIGTTCDGECWQSKIANGRIFRVADCGGGGGGGMENTCNYSQEAGHNFLNSVTIEHLTEVSSSSENEDGPDANMKIRKPVQEKWNFLQLNYPMGFYSKYSAYFNGVVYKFDNIPNDLWKFESLAYGQAVRTEGVVPPCTSESISVSTTVPVISGDERRATVILSYTANLSLSCLNNTVISTRSGTLPPQTFIAE